MPYLPRFAKLLIMGILVFPPVMLLVLSVGRQWPYPAVWPLEWTGAHWQLLVAGRSSLRDSLGLSLGISLGIATAVTALSFVLSRSIAYHPWRRYWLLAAYLPYVFAPVILATCLQFFFLRAGLAGRPEGVMLAQLLITLPYGVIFFSSFWNPQTRSLEQLVYTLGGSRWQALRRVLLPMARGPLLTGFFQLFLISWFEYGLTQLIGVGKVGTLPLQVFQYVQEANIFHAALAGCLLVLPPLWLLWFNKRYVFARIV